MPTTLHYHTAEQSSMRVRAVARTIDIAWRDVALCGAAVAGAQRQFNQQTKNFS